MRMTLNWEKIEEKRREKEELHVHSLYDIFRWDMIRRDDPGMEAVSDIQPSFARNSFTDVFFEAQGLYRSYAYSYMLGRNKCHRFSPSIGD